MRLCISLSKNSFDYFPYFLLCYTHTKGGWRKKKKGGKEKRKKKILLKNRRGQRFCVLLGDWKPSRRARTHIRAFRSLCYHRLRAYYKPRISCGRTKAKRHQIFFFFFFFYTASQQSFHNIISPLLPLPDRLYAGIAVCVCVYIGSFIIPSPGRFFLVIDGFCFPSRCVAFGPVYLPYNNKAPLCFHLRTWQLKFHFFFYLFFKRILFHSLTPFAGLTGKTMQAYMRCCRITAAAEFV